MFRQKPSISAYYYDLKKKVAEEIRINSDQYLLTVDVKEYADYLFGKYGLIEVEFDNDRETTIEKVRKEQKVTDAFGDQMIQEVLYLKLRVPILPNRQINEILQLEPSRGYLNRFEMIHENNYIVTEILPSENEVAKALERLKEEIANRNTNIRYENANLASHINQAIANRRSKIENEQDLLESITSKIPVTIHQKNDISAFVPTTFNYKEKIKAVSPPQSKKPRQLYLPEEKFNAILGLIDNSCRQFERTPHTFAKLEEEELRDVILSNLNGVFEGDAIGEAFSNKGKTDIYLKVDEGGVFIAECKYWNGTSTVEKVTKQILGYLTWRNGYGVVILFSKRTNFTKIVEKLKAEIPSLESFKRSLDIVSDTHFKSKHKLPGDDDKLIEIHFMIYNLYTI